MHEHDPYQPPHAAYAPPAVASHAGEELAGRFERLAAAILDSIIMLVVVLPAMYFGGFFETMLLAASKGEDVSMGVVLGWGGVSFLMFLLIQGYPLYRSGQTWGKKLTGIRIVDLQGAVPAFGKLLVLRYLVGSVIGQVPFVGNLYTLVDSLFVFRNDRRCIHDLIAGTRVVVVR